MHSRPALLSSQPVYSPDRGTKLPDASSTRRRLGVFFIARFSALLLWLKTIQLGKNAYSERSRELAMLLETSNALSSIHDRDELLQMLCRKMIAAVESTYCRICLLEEDGTRLRVRAASAIRDVPWEPGIGRVFSVDALPRQQQVLAAGEPVVLRRDELDHLEEIEHLFLFAEGERSVLLIPLAIKGRTLGLAVLGEARAWSRTPFHRRKIEICRAMVQQGALALENVQAVEQIAEQSRQSRLFIENLAEGVYYTDRLGRIEHLNAAAERITGYTREEMVGHSCAEIMQGTTEHGEACCSRECPLQAVVQSTPSVASAKRKEWILRQDGTRRLIAYTAVPFIDEDQRITGAAAVIRDITEEEELIRQKSDFISMVSHQLCAPLASINSATDLLARKDLDDSNRRDLYQVLHEQTSHLFRLANQVLQSSRLEQGQIAPALEPIAVPALIEQMIGIYRVQYGDHDFFVRSTQDQLFALGDMDFVRVILENLLQNAIRYSPSCGPITISAQAQGDEIEIAVADHGIGIPSDQLQHIFSKFHRVPEQNRRKTGGFGLGLYIARLLVEAQGGRIWAASQPGKGSCLYFTLKRIGADETKDFDD